MRYKKAVLVLVLICFVSLFIPTPSQERKYHRGALKINETFLAERANVFKERKQLVQKICSSGVSHHAHSAAHTFTDYLRWDYRHNVAFCSVAQAGEIFWETNLLKLTHPDENKLLQKQKQLFSFPRGKNLSDSVDVFSGIFTFMFVRDPFERLNSAFQVKIVDEVSSEWLAAIPQKDRVEGKNTLPTFSDFVQHVIKDEKFRNEPSLRPYGDTCSFCYLNYDLIGHTETFAEDTMHIVEKAGVRESIGQLRDLDMFEDPEPINRFTELTQEEMKKLYEIYKLDFEAFGYNFSAYLKQAVDANSNSGNSHANNNGRNKWKKSR